MNTAECSLEENMSSNLPSVLKESLRRMRKAMWRPNRQCESSPLGRSESQYHIYNTLINIRPKRRKCDSPWKYILLLAALWTCHRVIHHYNGSGRLHRETFHPVGFHPRTALPPKSLLSSLFSSTSFNTTASGKYPGLRSCRSHLQQPSQQLRIFASLIRQHSSSITHLFLAKTDLMRSRLHRKAWLRRLTWKNSSESLKRA